MITPWDYTVAVASACINILFGFYVIWSFLNVGILQPFHFSGASSHPSHFLSPPTLNHHSPPTTSLILSFMQRSQPNVGMGWTHPILSNFQSSNQMRSANLTAQVQPFEGKDTRIFDVVLCYLALLCTKNINLFWQSEFLQNLRM
ncbi:unnamed protein product [Ilex paraguariensis]|uniref:Uncharacterized protein n=1 Tax=Ilex paraguariensis TaxID=185542 RepID=A0ABC8TVW5_9AQUA